jgi:hypothetical protein
MTIKEQAIRIINSLPDDCTIEDIQYHLYVYERVERGIIAIDNGKVVSQEEAERRIKECLNSTEND